MKYKVKYPRRVIVRRLIKFIVKGLLNRLTINEVSGLEKIPEEGPLIMVGNHTGAMEVVLMGAYSPRIVEFLGAMEMPWHGWMGWVIDLYGLIPVYRGYTSIDTMRVALGVLEQGGVLGIFPEGGFWEPGSQKVQSGAAWLSYMSGAPVLPVGFGDTRGMMAEAFAGDKPTIEMNVGDLLPPVTLDKNLSKKLSLQRASDQIMEGVWEVVPEEEKIRKEKKPEDEIFTLKINIRDRSGEEIEVPDELVIADGSWISRFAHRPNLIDSIRDYIFIPVQVLKELDRHPSAEEIFQAADSMLNYVENENPQYYNYRYGYQGGQEFHNSFLQLRELMRWTVENDYLVDAEVRYEFTNPLTGEHQVRTVPEEVEQW